VLSAARRVAALLAAPAAATLLLLGPVPVAAATCAAGYASQLRDVSAALAEGEPPDTAIADLQSLAARAGADDALAPVLAALRRGDRASAETRLQAAAATLGPPPGVGCSSPYTGAARQALTGVYRTPALAGLDQPTPTSWFQQLLEAIARFFQGLAIRLGPLLLGLIGGLILAAAALLAAWRLRHHLGGGRQPEAGDAAERPPADPETEWSAALAAAGRGEYREAVRRAFRSALVSLAVRGRLAVQSSWTTTELLAHAGADPELAERLAPAAHGFDRAWYSGLPVGQPDWERARERCLSVRALAGRTARLASP
jgi:hypothetical protein